MVVAGLIAGMARYHFCIMAAFALLLMGLSMTDAAKKPPPPAQRKSPPPPPQGARVVRSPWKPAPFGTLSKYSGCHHSTYLLPPHIQQVCLQAQRESSRDVCVCGCACPLGVSVCASVRHDVSSQTHVRNFCTQTPCSKLYCRLELSPLSDPLSELLI